MVSSFILAVTEPRTGFLWSRDEVRGKLPLELLTSRPEKVQSAGWSSRERTGTKDRVKNWRVASEIVSFRLARYANSVSISAKNAVKGATNADSVSLISSPIFSFTIDFSERYLVVSLALSVHITPWFCSSEVQIIRNSFRGFPSFPSSVLLR